MRVEALDGDEIGETAASAQRLRNELLRLDIDAADPVADSVVPEGAKGLSAVSVTIGVRLGAMALGSLFAKLRDWVGRSGQTVEVSIGGDLIKIPAKFPEQQEQAIAAWLARHATSD
ncbi:hypothetical protein HGA13_10695 [Nocardia speluncae]|uniref:Uncharacterized protein n=1 Tax=Nocardia speluncae TaxID=419477 RepID=A0A846XBW2_9NOCA|nr:hypothetical protein [Nocardia speluncae]NKY33538.1 hypothetical protein [Nocardia speluncae]